MDWSPKQPDGDSDDLDCLLAEARWDEPAPEAIDRLHGHWRSLMTRRRRRRLLASLLMAASILLVVVGLMSWLCHGLGANRLEPMDVAGKDVIPSPPQPVRRPAPIVKQRPASILARKQAPANPPVAQSSRPPNAYERLTMIAYQRTRASRARPIESPPMKPPVEQIAEQPVSDQRTALRQRWSSLLAENNLRSMQAFLQRVEDRRTSAEALDCLAAVPNPPVELLFRCLRGPAAAQRTAAALALGRLNQAVVSQRLIAMIMRGMYRQEAMIALLSSSEPTARQFVVDAERNQMLSATLWNAKRQFQHGCWGGS